MRMGKKEPVRPGTVVQGYRVERKLGEGGFAQVYLAKGAEREVALKFIRLEEAGEWAKRELSILLYLRHPNVVKLVGHVEGPEQAPGYLVLITEYVKGRTLYEWAKEENPSAREVARVVRELSRALAALLSAGLPEGGATSEACLVREVAPPWKPPEAGAGAVPPRADTPAPVVPVMTLRKGETLVKERHVLQQSNRSTAQNEVAEALSDLSRRPAPDRTGAISGDPKQTLGALLKSHGATLSIPRPLDAAVEKAWGYASEVGRHLQEGREPSAEEAELVTTVCAAVVTYLVKKHDAGSLP